jgi:hypothetical protein
MVDGLCYGLKSSVSLLICVLADWMFDFNFNGDFILAWIDFLGSINNLLFLGLRLSNDISASLASYISCGVFGVT